jgi:AraC-like DNA-binding protein
MVREQHDDNLILLCTQGLGWLEAEGALCKVAAGDVVLLPRGMKHSYRADSKLPWSIYWMHFDGEKSDEFMTLLGDREERIIHPGATPKLTSTCEDILAVGRTGFSGSAYVMVANLLRYLLCSIAEQRDQNAGLREGDLNLASVQAYMRSQVTGKVSLTELATIAGVSVPHFAERYRELTGYPPIKHYTHMKIEAACRLLDSTEQSVKRVAGALGYDDALYFSRVFRKVIGVSPKAYRASRLAS